MTSGHGPVYRCSHLPKGAKYGYGMEFPIRGGQRQGKVPRLARMCFWCMKKLVDGESVELGGIKVSPSDVIDSWIVDPTKWAANCGHGEVEEFTIPGIPAIEKIEEMKIRWGVIV